MSKAVIVTRVSTGEQVKHGTSLAAQLEACRAKASALGMVVVGEYEDAGISGAVLKQRLGMQAALEQIKLGNADTLVCASLSRYSRDVEHQHQIRKLVRASGGRVVFCDIDFEDTPEGDLAFNVLGGFAEYERKLFRHRSMAGKLSRSRQGVMVCRARQPYGYHIPTKADIMRGAYPLSSLGKYVIVESEAEVVREIFEKYASGAKSLYQLATELNLRGVPTPKGGPYWRSTSIKSILMNPVHKGEPAVGKMQHRMDETRLTEVGLTGKPYVTMVRRKVVEESEWIVLSAPAIVSPQVWQQAQDRRATNKTEKSGNPERAQMLAGKVRCPRCGYLMVYNGSRDKKYKRYTCPQSLESKRMKASGERCPGPTYSAVIVEQAVKNALRDLVESPSSVPAQVSAYNVIQSTDVHNHSAEITALTATLADIRCREASAVKAQMAGIAAGASEDAYAGVFAELAAERRSVEARITALQNIVSAKPMRDILTPDDIQTKAIQSLLLVLESDTAPGSQKRDLLSGIIVSVVPSDTGATIQLNKEFVNTESVQFVSIMCTVSDGVCGWLAEKA